MNVVHVTLSFLQHLIDITDVPHQILLDSIDGLDISTDCQRNQSNQLRLFLDIEPNLIVPILKHILIHFLH
jgi:hypothetical protein